MIKLGARPDYIVAGIGPAIDPAIYQVGSDVHEAMTRAFGPAAGEFLRHDPSASDRWLLDLWAAWCGPCRIIAPMIDELASEMAGKVRFAKLNIDENPTIAARFGVSSIPTLLVFKAGRVVDRMVGVQPKPEIKRRLEIATA